jgi:multisubunit Na+/H+ antiporter MnhE subunit
MKRLLNLFVQWVSFLLLWLVFVFQLTAMEFLAAAAASALTVFALQTALRAEHLCFLPRWRWVAQGWRLPGMIAVDLFVVLKTLIRLFLRKPSTGLFQLGRFRATAEDCRASAQRALTIFYVSASPNSVVVDIDRENANLLIHQLEPTPIPKIARKLEE